MIKDIIKEAYFYFRTHSYHDPKYLLIKPRYYYSLIRESYNDLEEYGHIVQYDKNFRAQFMGMIIIETNSIDTEFEIV